MAFLEALYLAPGFRPLAVITIVSNVYGLGLILGSMAARSDWLVTSGFSLRKYYLLMGWAPLTFLALALLVDGRYLVLFVVAGVAGIVGELVVSVLWRQFFDQPIWTYSYRSVLRGYTSTLNFFPWAVGALFLHTAGRFLTEVPGAAPSMLRPVLVAGVALLGSWLVVWPWRRWSGGDRSFSKRAFAVFCVPIGVSAVALGIFCGPAYPLSMAAFSLVGFLTEYSYGRGMSLFFERGLWTYNHWQIDQGHTSFVTFPLWALGGLYFHLIARALGL